MEQKNLINLKFQVESILAITNPSQFLLSTTLGAIALIVYSLQKDVLKVENLTPKELKQQFKKLKIQKLKTKIFNKKIFL